MTRRRLLVIGAGVVTGGFLDEFVRCGGTDQYEVTVIGEEPYGPYNRLELNRVLRGAAPDELVTKPVDWSRPGTSGGYAAPGSSGWTPRSGRRGATAARHCPTTSLCRRQDACRYGPPSPPRKARRTSCA
jgi:hypothetical protein